MDYSADSTPPPELNEETALLAQLDQTDLEEGRVSHGDHYHYTRTSARKRNAAGKPHPKDALKPLVKNTQWQRTKYYIPFMNWLPRYSFALLGGDFLAGLTVASILIPQSISYATSLARLSPLAGLFSAAIPGAVYALLGTSRQLNVAPEASLSLLIGQAVTAALHGDPHSAPQDAEAIAVLVTTITTFQVGLFSFLLGFFRLGFIDVVLSRALLRGFVSAIAIVIMIEQLIPMFGLVDLEHKLNPHTTLTKLQFLIENILTHQHRLTTIISFGSLFILVSIRYFKGMFRKYWFIFRLPEVLLVVIVSTVLCYYLKWDEEGIDILGSVPIKTGTHFFMFPLRKHTLGYLQSTTSTAILIAVVGYLDSVVAAKQNADRFGYSISPNRELVALGAANIVGSFVPGTLPAYGSITRSRINADVGGRSQMASIICSAVVLFTTFFLLPWLYFLPRCVLAAVICLIVFNLLSEIPDDLLYFWRMKAWSDLGLMAITFFCTIIWNVEVGIVCSIVFSLLLVVHKSSKPRITILGRVPGTSKWKPVGENPDASEDVPGALIVRLRDSLDFANTAQLKERLRRLELYGENPSHPSEDPRREQASIIVFHMADVETCDATAAQIFYELLKNYNSRGTLIFLTHVRDETYTTFERAGIVELLGEAAFHKDVASAMDRIEMIEREAEIDEDE